MVMRHLQVTLPCRPAQTFVPNLALPSQTPIFRICPKDEASKSPGGGQAPEAPGFLAGSFSAADPHQAVLPASHYQHPVRQPLATCKCLHLN